MLPYSKRKMVEVGETFTSSYFTYKKKKESVNDKISKNILKTLEKWGSEGYEKWCFPFEALPLGMHVRYITKIKKGGKILIKARKGGVLTKIVDESEDVQYLVLKNPVLQRSWSVQFRNLIPLTLEEVDVGIYYQKEEFEKKTSKKKLGKLNKLKKKLVKKCLIVEEKEIKKIKHKK